jgi:hypothetical protein
MVKVSHVQCDVQSLMKVGLSDDLRFILSAERLLELLNDFVSITEVV